MLNTVTRYLFPSPHTFQHHKVCEKSVTELEHSQLSVLQDKEAHNDWFSIFNSRSGKLQLLKLIVDMSQSLESLILQRFMRLLIIHKAFN